MRRNLGHSLLEVIVASGVFVLIAVALSGIWVMYGKAIAKSGEHLAANQLARGVTEGLIANGFDWLEAQVNDPALTMPVEDNYSMQRQIRGREADIQYSILYHLQLVSDPNISNDICRIGVDVRWRSSTGSENIEGGKYNNLVQYYSYVYKGAL